MFFNLRDLELKKVPFDVEFPAGDIDFASSGLRQVGPACSRGVAELESSLLGEIRIEGRVTALLEGDCDRCLETLQVRVDDDFDLHYRPLVVDELAPEAEIGEDDTDIAFYEGVGIELKEVLREFVFLSLPMQQICRDTCLGLCGKCGANLNHVSCGCVQEEENDQWSAFRDLKIAPKNLTEEK